MTLRLKLEAHLENGKIVWEELRCRIAIQIISFHSEVPERVRTRFTDIDWKALWCTSAHDALHRCYNPLTGRQQLPLPLNRKRLESNTLWSSGSIISQNKTNNQKKTLLQLFTWNLHLKYLQAAALSPALLIRHRLSWSQGMALQGCCRRCARINVGIDLYLPDLSTEMSAGLVGTRV